ncbi:Alpha/Beta hydrolase fold [Phytophthora cactorum]|nr:Alpha/Beta hydrolase fold [Phytophthora cactorum]
MFTHIVALYGGNPHGRRAWRDDYHSHDVSFCPEHVIRADNFYRSNNVTIQPITFPNQFKMNVAGNLFTPKNLDANGTAPAIIEQSANLYATKMADQGFDLYAESFSAAVDYLSLQNFIDSERMVPSVFAAIDSRIKAVATSSMYDMGAANRNGLRHAQTVEQRKEIIEQMSQQRSIEAAGGEDTSAIQREFYDFYRTVRGEYTPPGSSPNVTTHPTLSSTAKFMNFYPLSDIDSISPRPLLFVTGDQAHSLATEPKELYWVAGAGHVDLYDRVDLIPFDKFTEFFTAGLAANATHF